MTNTLTTQVEQLSKHFELGTNTDQLITTLKYTAFSVNKGEVSDTQMVALLIVANQYKLNPWTKEIYAFPDKGAIVPIVGVDGWSRIINSHSQFDGMDFEQDDEKCTCIIYRKDRQHPIKVTEWHDECYRPPFTSNGREIKGPWQSHPKRMLRHKAMIQCARIAFGFVGIFDQDEAERIKESTSPTTVNTPEVDEAVRAELIKRAEESTKNGLKSFANFWMNDLSKEERVLIGKEEQERLKAQCSIDAEFSEVEEVDHE